MLRILSWFTSANIYNVKLNNTNPKNASLTDWNTDAQTNKPFLKYLVDEHYEVLPVSGLMNLNHLLKNTEPTKYNQVRFHEL